ncbi:S-4TM family putative pore-forming effector [uncultured Clostridium sp.]|uniref:S-4TM family putative pore-forming effector n=1 Tax=uncultured Clostridium sp. TaxID=59620 RepID=UPI0025CF93A0|nr:S-4TM family putative pore-forming effector [uncultured Clostridium sp.]
MSKISNGINQRQNEENSILMLAAQRQIYKEAKIINRVIAICSVIIPFISVIISLVITDNRLSLVFKLISIISWVASLLLGIRIKETQGLAALIQQQFDVYVFSFEWDKKLFRRNKDVTYIITQKAKKLLKKRTIEDEKLPDWYTKEVDELPLNKAIKLCQEENINWDSELRKHYSKVTSAVVISLVVIIIAMGIYKKDLILAFLSFAIPIFQWEVKVITAIFSDLKRLNKLSESINDIKISELDELLEIQRDIYEHRKNCYLIDDKIQVFLRDKLEKKNKDRVNYEIRNKKDNISTS